MKATNWLLALWLLLFSTPAFAGTLGATEVAALHSDISSMMAAMERGDPEPIIERTHPSLKKLMGGDEAFANVTRQAMTLLAGMRFISSELGPPTRTYAAGDEEVCFVPRVAVMEIGDARVKSTTFMVAIRDVGGSRWTYLDGAGLRKNPGMLRTLLPALEADVALPPNEMEQVD
jgi:hypothetical protein